MISQRTNMILYLLAIVTFLTFIFHRLLSPLNYWSKQGIKQRNPWGAFLFNWFIFLKRQNVVHFVENLYTEFPSERYSGCYQFNKPALVLRDPDLIRDVTIKKFDYFTDRRTYVPEEADPLWGKNLFALKGAQWRNMRSTLSPAFTGSKLKGVFVLMQSCARNFVYHFSEKKEELIDVEVKDVFTRFCNDVIATTAFGVEVDSLKRPENEFYVMGRKATNFSTYKMAVKFMGFLIAPRLYKLLRIKFFDDDVSAFFRTLIDDAILLREQKKVYRPDVIQLLLEARNGERNSEASDNQSTTSRVPTITNEEITAQALVFFFAGFESLSTLMTFAAYELAINPEVQDELRREIQKTSEKCSGDLTYDALVNMKYLDMVISETLRKWPSQVAAERICTEPCVLEEAPGLKLAVGDVVIFPTYGLHHDPVYFPRPELFDPERFSEANRAGIRPYSFQPFGLGPRNCIGSRFAVLEAKILFFYLLGSFEIVPVEKSVVPVVLDKKSMVLAAEGGMWLGLKRLGSS